MVVFDVNVRLSMKEILVDAESDTETDYEDDPERGHSLSNSLSSPPD